MVQKSKEREEMVQKMRIGITTGTFRNALKLPWQMDSFATFCTMVRIWLLALMVTLAPWLAGETLAAVDLNAGLVASYPFNGNTNDESGNGHNGIVHGATLTADRFGSANRAYYFNATNPGDVTISLT